MKTVITILLSLIVINCTLQVPIEEPVNVTENIIEEVQIMELQPIEEYENYMSQENGKTYGITGNELKEVILKDTDKKVYQFADFFIVGGTIYIAVEVMEQGDAIPETEPVQYEAVLKTYYFTQTAGVITEIQETEYPEKPVTVYIEMDSKPFKIIKSVHEDIDMSEVYQGTLRTGYKQIDSYVKNDVGLWFSVLESFGIRLKGVYFYGEGANIIRVKEEGRIW